MIGFWGFISSNCISRCLNLVSFAVFENSEKWCIVFVGCGLGYRVGLPKFTWCHFGARWIFFFFICPLDNSGFVFFSSFCGLKLRSIKKSSI